MNVKFNPKMSNVLASRHDSGKVRLYDIRLESNVGGYEFEVGPYKEQNFGSLQFNESGTCLLYTSPSPRDRG